MRCGSYAFDRLIEGQIQRISRTTGDHAVKGLLQLFQHYARDELHALEMCNHRIAGKNPSDFAVTGERDVHYEVVPSDSRDLQQFAVKRIIFGVALRRAVFTHELRAMQDLDRFLSCQARSNE